MIEVKLLKNENIPKDAVTTACAMMPRVLSVITAFGGEVWVGRNKIRTFKHSENAMLKYIKVYLRERKKANAIHKKLTENGPLFIRKNSGINTENKPNDEVGFENAG